MINFFGQEHAIELLNLLLSIQNGKENKSNEYIPQGILCFGPPGTGKTLFAKKAAETLEKELIIVDSSIKPEKLKKVITEAKNNQNHLLLLDEIDLICKNGNIGVLLTELDGNPNLFVIATTSLDIDEDYFWIETESLKRPGRFDITIKFRLPNYDDRYDYIVNLLDNRKDINVKLMTTLTQFCSYAFIETYVKRLKMEINTKDLIYSDQDIIEIFDKIYSHEILVHQVDYLY